MALAVTPGAGASLATDVVSGQHYEWVKLASGEVGVSAALDKAAGYTYATGDRGLLGLAVTNEGAANLASADMRGVPIAVDFAGRLMVSPLSSLTATLGSNIDVTPASPVATDYLPVRLTDGTSFYTATGGGGGGSGTEYTEGDVDATIVGGAIMWEDTGDTLRAVSVAKPLPVAVQGTTTVSGTVTANAGSGPFPVSDNGGSLTVDSTQLPASLGQKVMAQSLPVVIASDQGALTVASHAVTDGGGSLTVDGTVTANAGVGPWPVTDNGGSLTVDGTVGVSGTVNVADGGGSLTVDNAGTFAVQAGQVAQDAAVSGNPVIAGLRASAAVPASMSADGDAVFAWGDRAGRTVVAQKAGTASVTSVADAAVNATLLAANTSRLGATIFNDSTATLFVKLGATASATSYTAKLYQDGYFEVPFGYTGQIDGIWSADTAGSARVTELT